MGIGLMLTPMARRPVPLRQDFGDDFAGDVGEAEVATLEFVGQAEVVDAGAVEDGGLQVVDVDGALGDVVPVIVGGAEGDAGP